MTIVVAIVASLMILAGIVIVINPLVFSDFIRRYTDKRWLYIAAVVARLVIGVIFLLSASQSRFPATLTVIGWVIVAVAVVLFLIGHDRFKRLVVLLFEKFAHLLRFAGVLAIAFGVFLAHAYLG